MTPQFDDIEVPATINLSFEVFCGCGAGLCNQSMTRKSRYRGEPQVVVEACEACLDAAKRPLEERIEELEQLLEESREETSKMQEELEEAREHF